MAGDGLVSDGRRPVQGGDSRDPLVAAADARLRDSVGDAFGELSRAVSGRLANWPSVTASGLGTLIAGGPIVAELLIDNPFTTVEYVATLVVGSLLLVLGPVIAAADKQSVRNHSAEVMTTIKDFERRMAEMELIRQRSLGKADE